MGGKCSGKKQSPHFLWTLFFSSSGKKQSPWKVRTLFLFTVCPPMSGTLFFFRAEMFGLLKDKIPLVCWSQGSGYSLRVSKGSLYRVRRDQIQPKCWGWSNLTWIPVDTCQQLKTHEYTLNTFNGHSSTFLFFCAGLAACLHHGGTLYSGLHEVRVVV